MNEHEREVAFWEQAYIIGLTCGASPEGAKQQADQALSDRRELIAALRIEVQLVGPSSRRAAIEEDARAGRKIKAIKGLRATIAGMTLMDAKHAVEYFMANACWPDDI